MAVFDNSQLNREYYRLSDYFDDNITVPTVVSSRMNLVVRLNQRTVGAGDQLEIRIFNQEDLTGEYTVNGAGNISMPLIGTVKARGATVKELEGKLKDKLTPDWRLNPRVNIQVLNYRP